MRTQLGFGTKSASKIASSSPFAVFKPCSKRAGFKACAIGARGVVDIETICAVFIHGRAGERLSLVWSSRPGPEPQEDVWDRVNRRDGPEQSLNNIHFVEKRKLNGDHAGSSCSA
ncbi:MAG: hypothetical protein WKF84_24750 [Pyrinomonadaceae bacterium]